MMPKLPRKVKPLPRGAGRTLLPVEIWGQVSYINDMGKSVYVHIPFCLSKCRYCAFNSAPATGDGEIERYCRALEHEIANSDGEIQNLETLYFGGGTPTLLDPYTILGIMSALRRTSAFDPQSEITIEANPETVDQAGLAGLLEAGFNRLSLGVQTFDDQALNLLGRAHDGRRAADAFRQARREGFGNIGVDLIFGIPGQTVKRWRRDLEAAMELNPEHVSAYSLTYETGTEFTARRGRGELVPCPEELEAELFLEAIEALTRGGYQHYEVSNFAKPGFRSRHNINYWSCGDYAGFGAGAHSHRGGERWANVENQDEYVRRIENKRSAVDFEENLTREQMLFEAVFLGLRMVEGIDVGKFRQRWGKSPLDYKPDGWTKMISDGSVVREGAWVRLSKEALLVADGLLAYLAP